MAPERAAWRQGDAAVCPAGEACWLADASARPGARNAGSQHLQHQHRVTMFIASAARPSDADGSAVRDLLLALATTRRALGLQRAPAVVVFDVHLEKMT